MAGQGFACTDQKVAADHSLRGEALETGQGSIGGLLTHRRECAAASHVVVTLCPVTSSYVQFTSVQGGGALARPAGAVYLAEFQVVDLGTRAHGRISTSTPHANVVGLSQQSVRGFQASLETTFAFVVGFFALRQCSLPARIG
jgi:hypothetical protein